MKQLGTILIAIGILALIYLQLVFDTSVKVEYEKYGSSNIYGLPERVNNLSLMQDKQNYTFISLGVILIGVILYVTDNRVNKSKSSVKIKNQYEDKDYFYCKKCGELQELDVQELDNKKFFCFKCGEENLLEAGDSFYCKKCGQLQELNTEELENKKFTCCKCETENII